MGVYCFFYSEIDEIHSKGPTLNLKYSIEQGILPKSELHIWHIELPDQVQNIKQQTHLLDRVEKLRLNKFSHPFMRQNYLLIRITLRNILGKYLKSPPARVSINTNPYNKPQLCPLKGQANLQFNISHCANSAVIAFALNASVGVDLELCNKKRNIKALLSRYFSPQTIEEIDALPQAERHEAFLRVWTKFEAYKKAVGTGLRGGDQAIYIPQLPPSVDQFQLLFPGDTQQNHWLVSEVNSEPGTLISVVVDKRLKPRAIKHFSVKIPV